MVYTLSNTDAIQGLSFTETNDMLEATGTPEAGKGTLLVTALGTGEPAENGATLTVNLLVHEADALRVSVAMPHNAGALNEGDEASTLSAIVLANQFAHEDATTKYELAVIGDDGTLGALATSVTVQGVTVTIAEPDPGDSCRHER